MQAWDRDDVLRRFLVGGRLVAIPASRSKRRAVLDRLAAEFEPGRHYTEAEVSATLRAFHPDYASLRRYLVDEGFLDREAGVYWRSGGSFDVDRATVRAREGAPRAILPGGMVFSKASW